MRAVTSGSVASVATLFTAVRTWLSGSNSVAAAVMFYSGPLSALSSYVSRRSARDLICDEFAAQAGLIERQLGQRGRDPSPGALAAINVASGKPPRATTVPNFLDRT